MNDQPIRQPPYSIEGSLAKSVVAELEELLARARQGKIVGVAYVVHPRHGALEGGTAGTFGRDGLKAAGALLNAAMAATRD